MAYPLSSALKVYDEAERSNNGDLLLLLEIVAGSSLTHDTGDLFTVVQKRANNDIAAIEASLACAYDGFPSKISIALSSSLKKLVGTLGYSGILKDMMETKYWDYYFDQQNASFVPQNNEITVAKTLGVYIFLALQGLETVEEYSLLSQLKFAYPATYEGEAPCNSLPSTSLFMGKDEAGISRMLIPNAGFVFGGNLIQGELKGTDASGFIAYVTNTSRASTMLYADAGIYSAALQNGLKEVPSSEVGRILDSFNFITTGDMKPGDVLVWRSPSSGSAGVFVERVEDSGEVYTLGANRYDDKSFEGVGVQKRLLHVDGFATYILRSKLSLHNEDDINPMQIRKFLD